MEQANGEIVNCENEKVENSDHNPNLPITSPDSTNNHPEFQDLPIEVIEKICNYLHPYDLAAISLTCQTYKNTAEKCFNRKNKNHCRQIVHVDVNSIDSVKYLRWNRTYEIRFRMAIPNLHVTIRDSKFVYNALRFINENCSQRLRYLHLNCYNLTFIDGSDAEMIKNQIRYLEVLEIRNIEDIYPIVRWCKELKILIVNRSWQKSWSNLRIPILKSIIFNSRDCGISLDLRNFLKLNQQLKHFVFNNASDLALLLSLNIRLPYVAVIVDDIKMIHRILKKAELLGRIERLDIKMENVGLSVRQRVVQNDLNNNYLYNFLYGVHGFGLLINRVLPNVQRLCIKGDSIDEESLNKIITFYPNLIELRLDCTEEYPIKVLRTLVTGLMKVKRIYFEPGRYVESARISMRDADELNLARSTVDGASRMIIHYSNLSNVPSDAYSPYTRFVSINNDYYDCPLCNYNYPTDEHSLNFSDYLNFIR